jgi:hypothetical protein
MLEEVCLRDVAVQDVVVVALLLAQTELVGFGGVGRGLVEHVRSSRLKSAGFRGLIVVHPMTGSYMESHRHVSEQSS